MPCTRHIANRLMALCLLALLWTSCSDPGKKETSAGEPHQEIKNFDALVDAENISIDSLDKMVMRNSKPVILYFSGYACVNSRKLEEEIFMTVKNNPAALDPYIVKFMVDDKTPLPQKERYFSRTQYDSITTHGERGSEIQQMFGRVDQPCFLKIDNGYHVTGSLTYITRDSIAVFFGK